MSSSSLNRPGINTVGHCYYTYCYYYSAPYSRLLVLVTFIITPYIMRLIITFTMAVNITVTIPVNIAAKQQSAATYI